MLYTQLPRRCCLTARLFERRGFAVSCVTVNVVLEFSLRLYDVPIPPITLNVRDDLCIQFIATTNLNSACVIIQQTP